MSALRCVGPVGSGGLGDGRASNAVGLFLAHAQRDPAAVAFIGSRFGLSGGVRYTRHPFGEVAQEVGRVAGGLLRGGVVPGMRVLLLVRPGVELAVLVWALWAVGAVPVIVDPGMGLSRLRACLRRVAPEALVAMPLAHALSGWVREALAAVRIRLSTGAAWWPGVVGLQGLCEGGPQVGALSVHPVQGGDLAAIFFTSGSTGTPKGVEVTHRGFRAMVAQFQDMLGPDAGSVSLAAFAANVLLDPCMGLTCVIPDLGSRAPSRSRPDRLVRLIEDLGIGCGFASPVIWDRLSRHVQEHGISLPSLRRIHSGGSPVDPRTLARLLAALPQGCMLVTYGATEASPISAIDAQEVLAETAPLAALGHGSCVGRVSEGLEVRIVAVQEGPMAHDGVAEAAPLAAGQVGEVMVRGAAVSAAYHLDAENTVLAKVRVAGAPAREGATVWHRTGDAAYFDAQGRLWHCGRVKHAVWVGGRPWFSVQAEEALNAESAVWRSAMVGVQVGGVTGLWMVVELAPGVRGVGSTAAREAWRQRLRRLGFPVSGVLVHPGPLPVDRRHNSKIERHEVARWAQRQVNQGAGA